MRQRRQVALEIVGVNRLDHTHQSQVQAASLRPRNFVVKRFAKQGVRELVAAGLAQVVDHPRVQGLLDRVGATLLVAVVEQASQQAQFERPTDHRGRGEHPIGRVRQAVQAPADHLLDALRNAQRSAAACGCGVLHAVVREHLLQQQAGDLADEQRVALGLLMDRVDPGGRQGSVASQTHHASRLGARQAGQAQALEAGLARQFAQGRRQRMLARQLDVAVGDEHQHPARREARRQEFQQAQRRRVGPVQVVEHQQQRGHRSRPLPEAGDRVEQAKPRLCGIDHRRRRLAARHTLQDLRHDFGQRGGLTRCNAPHRVVVGASQPGLHHLLPRPVRRCARLFVAAAPEHRHAARQRVFCQALGRARLADARIAGQRRRAAGCGQGARQQGVEDGEFALAADEAVVVRRLIGDDCGSERVQRCAAAVAKLGVRQAMARAARALHRLGASAGAGPLPSRLSAPRGPRTQ